MKKEIEAFVNSANEQELEAAWKDVYKRQTIVHHLIFLS